MANPPAPYEGPVTAYYEKAKFFRVIHADGVYGGPTPQGQFQMAFFSERNAIPRKVEFDIVKGAPGPERVVESRAGLFREVEANVVMTFPQALGLYEWLGRQLAASGAFPDLGQARH